MRLTPLLALPLLFGCASPQELCLSKASHDLRVVDALIDETEQNLARGYAIEKAPAVDTSLELCLSPDDAFLFCTSDRLTVAERPVALDVAAERGKLTSLRAKRTELGARTAAQAAQCRALPSN